MGKSKCNSSDEGYLSPREEFRSGRSCPQYWSWWGLPIGLHLHGWGANYLNGIVLRPFHTPAQKSHMSINKGTENPSFFSSKRIIKCVCGSTTFYFMPLPIQRVDMVTGEKRERKKVLGLLCHKYEDNMKLCHTFIWPIWHHICFSSAWLRLEIDESKMFGTLSR